MAMKESSTGQMRLEDDPVDLLTKVVTGQKRKNLVSNVLCDINDENT